MKSSSENSNLSFNKIGAASNIKSNGGVLSRSASADIKSSISRKGNPHEQFRIKSPGLHNRSSSAEPEFLRFWMEKDRAGSASSSNIEQGTLNIIRLFVYLGYPGLLSFDDKIDLDWVLKTK